MVKESEDFAPSIYKEIKEEKDRKERARLKAIADEADRVEREKQRKIAMEQRLRDQEIYARERREREAEEN